MDKSQKNEVERYLTQMKEFPEDLEGDSQGQSSSVKKVNYNPTKVDSPKPFSIKNTRKERGQSDKRSFFVKMPFTLKELVLGVINFVAIILSIFLLLNFPKAGEEIKKLRYENTLAEEEIPLEIVDVETAKGNANKLKDLFIDESGVVNFVREVEDLKKDGVVTNLSIVAPNVLKDRTGNFGVPVSIELKGSWGEIDENLRKIQALKYLFRVANIKIEPLEEEGDVGKIIFKYGVFLYVNEKLGKN